METPKPAEATIRTPPTRKRTRSPSYPYLALKDAIEKARIFWDAEKRHPAPIDAAAKDWGYDVKSSAVPLTVAALRKYGLLEDVGASGKQRQVKLTESALKILLNEETSPDRQSEIKTAALRPGLHRELWAKYGEHLPSDQTLQSWLLLDKKFNPASVAGFIKIYKETISFAKLTASDIVPDTTPQDEDEETMPPGATLSGDSVAFGTPPPGFGMRQQTTGKPPMTPGVRYLPIPLDIGDAHIPRGMDETDFNLLIETLQLWKKKIVKDDYTTYHGHPPTKEELGD